MVGSWVVVLCVCVCVCVWVFYNFELGWVGSRDGNGGGDEWGGVEMKIWKF